MFKFSRYLEGVRKIKGIDDTDMAAILGVSTERLKRIEAGHASPPPETLIAYANAVGISVEELVIHHLNEYASDFCRKIGIGRTLEMTWKQEEVCGALDAMEAKSRFHRNQGRSLHQSGM